MSLGKKNQGIEGTLLVLRIRTKENDVEIVPAVFSISKKKENGEWETLAKTETTVSGRILRLDLGKGTYDGKEYKTVKLYLVDAEAKETYLLDLRYNLLSRNLFNSLSSLTNFKDDVSISLYKSANAKTNKVYSNISLWQNDAMVKGKFLNTDLPKVEELKNSKGEVVQRDYCNLDDFFEASLKDLAKRIKEQNSSKTSSVSAHEDVNEPLFENAAESAAQGKDLI